MPASVRAVARSPGPAETISRSPAPTGRRRHVAPDGDVAPHVEQPHRKSAHLQAFPAQSEHDDAPGRDNFFDQPVERVVGHGCEYGFEIFKAP